MHATIGILAYSVLYPCTLTTKPKSGSRKCIKNGGNVKFDGVITITPKTGRRRRSLRESSKSPIGK